MMTTTTNLIRKNANGTYQFLTSAFASYCVMNRDQFSALIKELERLRSEKPTARHIPVAFFPDFPGQGRATRLFIRKYEEGYQLVANCHGDILCRMNQPELETLIEEFIRLQDLVSVASNQMEVYFPDFTYKITG